LHKNGTQYGLTRKKNRTEVKALDSVSFAAFSGEFVGVVGRNGSGKSTLFKVIAGSEGATSGTVKVSSEPTLLGVSSALQPHLDGLSNVELGLLASGLSPSEVEEKKFEVAEWADIGDAIYRPMATYSSGMRSRLTFSISTSIPREILLIDEALSTGDAAFASRAHDRMNSYLESAGSVFLVSHGAGTIQEYCSRALWLHEGRIVQDGEAKEVSSNYVKWANLCSRGRYEKARNFLREVEKGYDKPEFVLKSESPAAH